MNCEVTRLRNLQNSQSQRQETSLNSIGTVSDPDNDRNLNANNNTQSTIGTTETNIIKKSSKNKLARSKTTPPEVKKGLPVPSSGEENQDTETKRPTSFRLSTRALSDLGSSTKSFLKGDDNEDADTDEDGDVMGEEMMLKRQQAAAQNRNSGNSRRSSSGIQMDSFMRRRTSSKDDRDSMMTDSGALMTRKPIMSLNIYESGTGVTQGSERLHFRGDLSTCELSKEVSMT